MLMNLFSLSLTIFLGNPCNLKIFLNNKTSNYVVVYVIVMEKKWANLVSLSTNKKI